MREWLTVIVVLLIAGILLDGWRRMRQSRQGSIKMSRNIGRQTGTDKDESDGYGSELPNGGARVVGGSEPISAAKPASQPGKPPVREQVSLELDEDVPMLMDVDAEEPELPATDNETHASPERVERPSSEPSFSAPTAADDAALFGNDTRVEPSMNGSADSGSKGEVASDEVLVINVMAPQGTFLAGDALLDVILSCGMRYGDMNIFHRHETESGEGSILFSMANMVKPGDFDLNAMDTFETPGVSLFMSLPMKGDSLQAFDLMASTAHALQVQLAGELKDENRSVMTQQTLEHSRQRIREFERKQLSRVPV
jgi:cell division protein ZipA